MTCYVGDGELICERCAVDMTDDQRAIGGERDSPPHCSYCHRPLDDDFGLTDDGVQYVLASVRESLKRGTRNAHNGHVAGYYEGSGPHAVLRDWCELWVSTWRLDKRDAKTVDLFMFWTRPEGT